MNESISEDRVPCGCPYCIDMEGSTLADALGWLSKQSEVKCLELFGVINFIMLGLNVW